MDRSSSKPVAPAAESYGLSSEAAQRLDELFSLKKYDRLTPFYLVAGAVVWAVIMFGSKSDWSFWDVVAVLLTAGIAGPFSGAMAGLVLYPVARVIAWLVGLLTPDYGKYRQYRSAVKAHQKQLLEWLRTQLDWWRSLSGRQFEHEVAVLFSGRGYAVDKTKASGDEGVDLVLRRDGDEVLVQCKAHNKPVGSPVVREFLGALQQQGSQHGIIIATNGFSKPARSVVSRNRIELIDISELI